MANIFETTTCTRCGGSGKFSFNLMNGDRCFGCHGSGMKFTKRGSAARAFFVSLTEKPAKDVAVGDQLWDDTFGKKAKWMLVRESHANSQAGSWSLGTDRSTLITGADATVRSVKDRADLDAKLAAAVAYQATLLVSGKPAKKAA